MMKEARLEERLSSLGLEHKDLFKKLVLPVGLLLLVLMISITGTLIYGLDLWGINIPVAWGFAIVNFVWWIGIGHAGTFISAVLLLARQPWRSAINRLAETMTLFAVSSAGIYPLMHMGRVWYFYWLLPYPNDMDLYPQYRSPLTWDAFAVTTYALVSLLFWYLSLIPDLAIAKERTKNPVKKYVFSFLSLGFSGEIRQWQRFKEASFILALIATPLVVSVHTIVSLDFAVGLNPGWHATIFPPFFVTGAVYSGFAMVILLLLFVQKRFAVSDLITAKHLDKCARMLLLSGILVSFFYLLEFFMAWYADEPTELHLFNQRMGGEKAWSFWIMIFCNAIVVQGLWFEKLRSNRKFLFFVSLLILIGMWMERYVIVITTLMVSHLPSLTGHYQATIWDWGLFLGSFGLFLFGLTVVLRFLPFLPITEIKEELHHESV